MSSLVKVPCVYRRVTVTNSLLLPLTLKSVIGCNPVFWDQYVHRSFAVVHEHSILIGFGSAYDDDTLISCDRRLTASKLSLPHMAQQQIANKKRSCR